jgi:hypothetical protein
MALATASHANAQTTVYRCGPDGREYSATTCASGKAVNVDDTRTPEQRRDAQLAAQRDSALADRLAAERREREAAAPKGGAARLGPAAASAPAKSASRPAVHKPHKKSRKAVGDPTLSDPVRVPKPKPKPKPAR